MHENVQTYNLTFMHEKSHYHLGMPHQTTRAAIVDKAFQLLPFLIQFCFMYYMTEE